MLPLPWCIIFTEMGAETSQPLHEFHIYSTNLDFNLLMSVLHWPLCLGSVLWGEGVKVFLKLTAENRGQQTREQIFQAFTTHLVSIGTTPHGHCSREQPDSQRAGVAVFQ